ncbi:hypothetical protein Snov_2074 [Ancylobacter novellus DSM 506]|uniref:Uncharacterized protein n=1 Tax=Ancylobacter novellus (strain ATCC 8093 / DSM 506 / JCM 20403 / CCM 1077 / IAM 12100 / NBRC 12443 / NCIMB 10456) TaxID=639283 RepID=D7A0B1_ANCN5|nr:hypothetical protein [Ancylobacter novellus]ADH89372.1 hypothetical protein Snov_2074 [Ancylobacter novellus DSM 506]
MKSSVLKAAGGTAPAYDELCASLAAELLATVESFAARHGLGPLHSDGLRQMSVKLPDAAAELMMFGFNVWPDDLPAQ